MLKSIILISIIFELFYLAESLKGTAQLTYYHSYAPCCKSNPNYDPSFPTTECTDYSACKYPGYFAAWPDQKSFDWVKSNNIVALYDASDRYGTNWKKNYAGKKIRLTKNGKTFDAIIADTCGDNDCNGCCYRNSKGGYLVDIEYYTAVRNLGSANAAYGTISFEILSSSTTTTTASCAWIGHCLGDPCTTYNDCDNDWVCKNNKCSLP